MGERRVADRRAPEKGVIKIPFKDAIIYLIISIIILVSVTANIILASLYNQYKEAYESEAYYEESMELIDDDSTIEDFD